MPVDPYLFEKGKVVFKNLPSGEIAERLIIEQGRCPYTRDGQVETSCIFYRVLSHPYLNMVRNNGQRHCTISSMKTWGDGIRSSEQADFVEYRVGDYIKAIYFYIATKRIEGLSWDEVAGALKDKLLLNTWQIGSYKSAYLRLGRKKLKKIIPTLRDTVKWLSDNLGIKLEFR